MTKSVVVSHNCRPWIAMVSVSQQVDHRNSLQVEGATRLVAHLVGHRPLFETKVVKVSIVDPAEGGNWGKTDNTESL